MTDMTLIPTGAMGGNEAGAAGLGGAVGAFIGSAFSNGGLGGFGRGAVVADGTNAATTAVAGAAANMLTTALVSDIGSIQDSLNTIGLNIVQGQGTTNMTVANAAASSYTGLTSQNTQNMLANLNSFANVNASIAAGNSAILSTLNTNEVNNLTRSFQAQIAAAACCCETNLNIERQGNATRDLMREQFANSQAVLICDLKSQVQTRDFLISQAAQTAQLRCEINKNAQLINFKLPTPPTPPTGCC